MADEAAKERALAFIDGKLAELNGLMRETENKDRLARWELPFFEQLAKAVSRGHSDELRKRVGRVRATPLRTHIRNHVLPIHEEFRALIVYLENLRKDVANDLAGVLDPEPARRPVFESAVKHEIVEEIEAGMGEGRYLDCTHLGVGDSQREPVFDFLVGHRFFVECAESSLLLPDSARGANRLGIIVRQAAACPRNCRLFVDRASAEQADRQSRIVRSLPVLELTTEPKKRRVTGSAYVYGLVLFLMGWLAGAEGKRILHGVAPLTAIVTAWAGTNRRLLMALAAAVLFFIAALATNLVANHMGRDSPIAALVKRRAVRIGFFVALVATVAAAYLATPDTLPTASP